MRVINVCCWFFFVSSSFVLCYVCFSKKNICLFRYASFTETPFETKPLNFFRNYFAQYVSVAPSLSSLIVYLMPWSFFNRANCHCILRFFASFYRSQKWHCWMFVAIDSPFNVSLIMIMITMMKTSSSCVFLPLAIYIERTHLHILSCGWLAG